MARLIAHMATFPGRVEFAEDAARSIASQVDELRVVFNEFDTPPDWASRVDNLVPIIPPADTKDTGKFLPEVAPDDLVFLCDDDLDYTPGYVAQFLSQAEVLGVDKNVLGLHGTIYRRLFGKLRSLRSRKQFHYAKGLDQPRFVDQLGTGTVLVRGANLPAFADMETSQKFVDVRFARLACERGLNMVAIARPAKLLVLRGGREGSIYQTFTRQNPENVLAETRAFAGKNPKLGQVARVR